MEILTDQPRIHSSDQPSVVFVDTQLEPSELSTAIADELARLSGRTVVAVRRWDDPALVRNIGFHGVHELEVREEDGRSFRVSVPQLPGVGTETLVRRYDFTGLAEIVDQVCELRAAFPEVALGYVTFDWRHEGMRAGTLDAITTADGNICLSANYAIAARSESRNRSYEDAREDNWYVRSDLSPARALVTHEFGHLLAQSLTHRGTSPAGELSAFALGCVRSASGSTSPQAIAKEVSMYATSSEAELFAELFCEYFGSSQPRPAAEMFGRGLKR